MKKKVRTLKDYPSTEVSTFLLDADKSNNVIPPQSESSNGQNNDLDMTDKLENMHKKKKAMNKDVEFHQGLKYAPPSQRNHSSIYE